MATPEHHVYLLLGEEDLLVDQALGELLDRLIPPAERDLNLDVVRADEIQLTDLITLLDTLPFFGQRRAVIVKNADFWKPAEQERLAAYLERCTARPAFKRALDSATSVPAGSSVSPALTDFSMASNFRSFRRYRRVASELAPLCRIAVTEPLPFTVPVTAMV